ncbi:MAG TPA: hypothetical protein VK818_21870 [Methylomirabilota bacterium]|jgi:hypothetical protein|nr:hypothetical protein [Methylomirabilota bacterium]
MMKTRMATLAVLLFGSSLMGASSFAQTATGTGGLQLTARITPTAARPEPVRQFTFYILSKSYAAVSQEVEADDEIPSRDKFIDELKVSPELKEWLKAHEILDLTMPGLDKALTADDVLHVPEFLLAYQRANSGGVTNGIPKPKYKDADKTDHPDKYKKQTEEYYSALRKFIRLHPETMSGMELEMDAVNPQRKWAKIESEHKKHVQHLAPDVAQTKYLVAKADTDLDGRAGVSGLPPGSYWVSSLNLDADAGDTRVRWDVPVAIKPGQTTRVELNNLNATDARGSSAP